MTRTPRLFLYAAAVTTATALAGIVSTPATTVASGTTPLADALTCDMAQYKSIAGLTATVDQNVLTVAWNGQNGSEMRTRYAIDGGQPIVRDLAVRTSGARFCPSETHWPPD